MSSGQLDYVEELVRLAEVFLLHLLLHVAMLAAVH